MLTYMPGYGKNKPQLFPVSMATAMQEASTQIMPETSPLYRPRNPQSSAYYRCVEDHFETFEQLYEERFERAYGFFGDLITLPPLHER